MKRLFTSLGAVMAVWGLCLAPAWGASGTSTSAMTSAKDSKDKTEKSEPAEELETAIYRAVDRNGTIVFTNVPTENRFRKIEPSQVGPRRQVPETELERAIRQHAKAHRVSPALVRAVIKAESDFDPDAVSRTGAMGLMQLMPKTASHLEVRDPYDPTDNISGGTRYLRYLLDRFKGNVQLALAAYNAGETRVEQYRALPPYQETRDYVAKVMRFYKIFSNSMTIRRLKSLPAKQDVRQPVHESAPLAVQTSPAS